MKAFKANINTILVSVITGIILMIATAVIGFVSTIRKNEISIKAIEVGKVDQEKFNSFLRTFAEHATLTHERIAIIAVDLDKLDKRQREIELTRLRDIETRITQLESKIRITLGDYDTYIPDSNVIDLQTYEQIKQCIKPESYDLQRTVKGIDQ